MDLVPEAWTASPDGSVAWLAADLEAPLDPAADFVWRAESVQLLVLSEAGELVRWNEGARLGLGARVALRAGLRVADLLPGAGFPARREAARMEPARAVPLTFAGDGFALTLSCSIYWSGDRCVVFGEPLPRAPRWRDEFLPICVECHSVRAGSDVWRPLPDFFADNGLLMTHGYCPGCFARARAELDRVLPRPASG